MIGFAVGSLAVAFAVVLIRNNMATSSWGFIVIPPPLILFYGVIVIGVGLGILGLFSTRYRFSRTLLFAAWIILAAQTYAFLTDGLFIFVLPSALFFFYLWIRKPAQNDNSRIKVI